MKHNQIISLCHTLVKLIITPASTEGWDESRHLGRMDVIKATIAIDTNMIESLQANTLLHELIHYIASLNDLPKDSFGEVHISVLATGLLGFLRNNRLLALELINGELKHEDEKTT